MDINEKPIDGITVTIKGAKLTTVTDKQGRFSIGDLASNAIIEFTGTGFESLEINADTRQQMKVILLQKVSALDEVQVIAYGISTQRYNVGSITKVKSEDFEKQPISNPLEALQGRVPGLVVTGTSGIPGASFNVQIRGQNTLRSDVLHQSQPIDNPLFIIDGVPFATQNENINQFPSIASPGIGNIYNNNGAGISPFNSINPGDIESVEVLKDADATAIYGSRGGNGVILITTKRGAKTDGNTDFVINANTGVSTVGKVMRMMSTKEYITMRKEALSNEGLTPNLTFLDEGYAPDILLFDPDRYTDWQNYFLGNSSNNTIVNTALSGGNQMTQFRIGAGFNKNTYVYPGDYSDDRINVSLSVNHSSPNKKLGISFSSIYSYNKNNSSGTPNLLTAYRLEPNFPELIDKYGNPMWEYKGNPFGVGTPDNPMAYLKNKYYVNNINLNNSFLISYQVADGLSVKSNLGYNSFNSKEYLGIPLSARNPVFGAEATASFGRNDFITWIIEPQLEYRRIFEKYELNVLAGTTMQRKFNNSNQMTGSGYINDDLIESISAAPNRNTSDASNEYKYAAMFGRINFRLANRYIVNINARRDGSSRFGPGKQYGNFGSIGAGWLFSEEQSLEDNLTFLSYGKLRGSYGITGSDGIADYLYMSRWATTNYAYDGQIGYLPQNLYNPILHWGVTKKFELGIELGVFKDRLLLNSTFYQNRSGNQLITYSLPNITGFNSVTENWNAVVQNTGWEISLFSRNINKKDFLWTTSFNITIPKNKLVSFPGIEKSSYNTRYIVGSSVNTILGFRFAGVNENTGLFQFFDSKGNITSSPVLPSNGNLNDYVPIGDSDPDFFGGIQNSVTYKKFSLEVFFDFKKQIGSNYLLQTYASLPGTAFNVPAALLSRWQAPGDMTNIQRFSSSYGEAYDAGRYFTHSSGAYSNASFLRCKNISISYTFARVAKELKLNYLRIYGAAQNPFTFTNYLGNDPETQNLYGIPTLRTVTMGIQLSL